MTIDTRTAGQAEWENSWPGTVVGRDNDGPPGSPATTGSSSDWPFVGRELEMTQLCRQVELAIAGRGGLVMLSGEPGIGKTRMAEELGAWAAERGARVVWARCWEGEGAPAYWLWAQVLRVLLSDVGAPLQLPPEVAPNELVQILPELAPEVPDAPDMSDDGSESRFRLFHAVATVLASAAEGTPLVVVLDDLHWAGRPSLALLHSVARGLRGTRLLVAGTYRDAEVGADHPLRDVFGQLVRDGVRIPVLGLSEADVAKVIAGAMGLVPGKDLVAAVHAQTEGNPFFVSEVVRLLMAEGLLAGSVGARPLNLAIPSGVREMIAARLRRVSAPCAEVLGLAAVIGREFDTSLLVQLTSQPAEQLLDLLQQAVSAHLLVHDSEVPGRFRFTHVLVRDTIYEELPTRNRLDMHRAVATALQQSPGAAVGRHLPSLAHHFFLADPTSSEALLHTVRAGDEANACLAYEDAVRYYERALEILERRGEDDATRWCQLLLSLGDARSKAVDVQGAREAFKAAAAHARRVPSAELLSRAAIGYGGRFPGMASGTVDQVLVGLLEESLVAVGNGDSAVRASLLARLSRALFYETDERRRLQLANEALAMARRVGDTGAQVTAYNARYWALTGAGQSSKRLAAATEMARLAMASGDLEMALQGHHWRLIVLAELGQMAGVDLEIDQYGALARELHQPLYLWLAVQFRVMRAAMSGRFDEAERLANEAFSVGEAIAGSVPVGPLFATQLLHLGWERGGLQDDLALLAEARAVHGRARAFAVLHLCRLGRQGEARAELTIARQHELGGRARDATWLGTVASLAEACVSLDERGVGEEIYRTLLPYAEYNVMVSPSWCMGSASHFLGLLASLLDRRDQAEVHFEQALDLNSRMGARPLVAHTQLAFARVLAGAEGDPSHDRARQLLAEASATARELGMSLLARRCAELDERLGQPLVSRPVPSRKDKPLSGNRFKKAGDYWEVRFGGAELRLKDAKGMRYLAELLRQPGREMHVADLAGATGAHVGHAGEVLDSRAKAQYRARIHDLKDDLAGAEQCNDEGRIAVLSEELDLLTHELAAAYGLGGRARRAVDTKERMRKAVTNRIRASVNSVAKHNPRLGQHLSNSIRTGNFCSYLPEEPTAWEV